MFSLSLDHMISTSTHYQSSYSYLNLTFLNTLSSLLVYLSSQHFINHSLISLLFILYYSSQLDY
jgi:hypothetical protein